MSTWLYQLSEKMWRPQRYRFDIWEGERWRWKVGRKMVAEKEPERGDIVVFFYAPSGGSDAGFYGWAVILDWDKETEDLYFRPTAPSDLLKMHPWLDDEALALANEIRGKQK